MFVIAHKSHGFVVGNRYYAVAAGPLPQRLPDEVRENASFQFVLKHGELVEVPEPKPQAEPERFQALPPVPAPKGLTAKKGKGKA